MKKQKARVLAALSANRQACPQPCRRALFLAATLIIATAITLFITIVLIITIGLLKLIVLVALIQSCLWQTGMIAS